MDSVGHIYMCVCRTVETKEEVMNLKVGGRNELERGRGGNNINTVLVMKFSKFKQSKTCF